MPQHPSSPFGNPCVSPVPTASSRVLPVCYTSRDSEPADYMHATGNTKDLHQHAFMQSLVPPTPRRGMPAAATKAIKQSPCVKAQSTLRAPAQAGKRLQSHLSQTSLMQPLYVHAQSAFGGGTSCAVTRSVTRG